MRKIYILGTVHDKLTTKYKNDLEYWLKKINPDQVLVEIVKKHLKTNKIKIYAKEMIYTYKWAIKNKKKTDGFDSDIEITKKGLSKKQLKRMVRKMKKWSYKNKFDWKSFNKKSAYKKYEKVFPNESYIDLIKDKKREKVMLHNINKRIIKKGIVLIITGSAHLKFLEKHLKKAIFPLRN